MDTDDEGSVTRWIGELKAGAKEAAQPLDGDPTVTEPNRILEACHVAR